MMKSQIKTVLLMTILILSLAAVSTSHKHKHRKLRRSFNFPRMMEVYDPAPANNNNAPANNNNAPANNNNNNNNAPANNNNNNNNNNNAPANNNNNNNNNAPVSQQAPSNAGNNNAASSGNSLAASSDPASAGNRNANQPQNPQNTNLQIGGLQIAGAPPANAGSPPMAMQDASTQMNPGPNANQAAAATCPGGDCSKITPPKDGTVPNAKDDTPASKYLPVNIPHTDTNDYTDYKSLGVNDKLSVDPQVIHDANVVDKATDGQHQAFVKQYEKDCAGPTCPLNAFGEKRQ